MRESGEFPGRQGDGEAREVLVMPCPECGGLLMVPGSDLLTRRRIGCPHCGRGYRLSPQALPGGSGRTWALVPMEDSDDHA